MITLWGRLDSTNVRKVLWCLYELNLKFTHIQAGGKHGLVNTPEYLRLNPNGLVPCLRDQDFVLWESNTIIRYLTEKYGQKNLYICEVEQRYCAEKWLDWCLGTITPIFKVLMLNTVKLPIEQRDQKQLQQAICEFETKLSILNLHLSKNLFIAGTQFSVVDIALASYVYSWKKLSLSHRQPFQEIENWFERLLLRPALKKVLLQESLD